ncbi:alpha/beta fold hydrolase [Bordetella sp. 2513F-2]
MHATPHLMIPGLNCSATLFRHLMPVLWRSGPVMVCDHRGADTIAGLADEILRNAPDRFTLTGFSMGGFIAFEILRRCPERVAKLALISTSARPEAAGGPAAQIRAERIGMAQAGRFDEIPPLHYANNVDPSRQADDALRAAHRDMTRDVGPAGYINQQKAIATRADSRAMLADIKVPTMIIVGEHDKLTPVAHAQELAAGIVNSELVVLEQCGHLAPLEKPEEVTRAIERWSRA